MLLLKSLLIPVLVYTIRIVLPLLHQRSELYVRWINEVRITKELMFTFYLSVLYIHIIRTLSARHEPIAFQFALFCVFYVSTTIQIYIHLYMQDWWATPSVVRHIAKRSTTMATLCVRCMAKSTGKDLMLDCLTANNISFSLNANTIPIIYVVQHTTQLFHVIDIFAVSVSLPFLSFRRQTRQTNDREKNRVQMRIVWIEISFHTQHVSSAYGSNLTRHIYS